jgi:hypothetical protein
MAVDLAKLSLWLATLAKDHPFTFLDHALRHGDSLVGLTRRQIADFHWLPTPGRVFGQKIIEERIKAATRVRQEIIEAGDEVPFLLKQQKLAVADDSLKLVRFAGNLVIAAFFAGDNDKQRKLKREELLRPFSESLQTGIRPQEVSKAEKDLRSGDKAIHPFHWEIEFPEVFGRENGGFDVFVGNPPYAGKSTAKEGSAKGYLDWLKATHAESHGNSDIVAHFFRRAFALVRVSGTCGFIATKTIAQGDTRSTGLRWICLNGGAIYGVRRRIVWPGEASRIVTLIHIAKGPMAGPFEIDGKAAERITAYLFHAGGHDDPVRLTCNANKCFIGSTILGMGFTFQDDETDSLANPMTLMHELIAKDSRNRERFFPFIGGEEVNESPIQSPRRTIINFGQMSESEARAWPDLMKIVEEKVKPQRLTQNRDARARYWWRFAETTPALNAAISKLDRVLVTCLHQPHWCVSTVRSNAVFSHALAVIAIPTNSAFGVLQARTHEVWARFFGSSMKDDLRYTPSDCFETFPFPENFESDAKLEAVGNEYYEYRAALMVKNNEGLTKTYNRFHDPHETSGEIHKLRELHAAMDAAVLAAYGWSDLQPTCEFLLDYEEEEEDEEETGKARRKKKPWRYRWPDEFRDIILARLLELNKQRAEAEALAGSKAEKKPKKARKSNKGTDQPGGLY